MDAVKAQPDHQGPPDFGIVTGNQKVEVKSFTGVSVRADRVAADEKKAKPEFGSGATDGYELGDHLNFPCALWSVAPGVEIFS